MVNNLVSCKTVISKVFSDLNLQESPNRILDMVEWTGEALSKIGAFPSLQTKITGDTDSLTVLSNYQATLPCDLHSVIQIGYSSARTGPFFAMIYDGGTLAISHKVNKESTVTSTVEAAISSADSDIVTVTQSLYNLTYDEALQFLNDNQEIRSQISFLIKSKGDTLKQIVDSSVESYRYVIVPGYIKTNVKDGYLKIVYKAVPTDDNGWPMVPDDEGFKEAIYWYIVMKMTYPEWREGRIRDAVYYDARSNWNYYSKQAYGNAVMPQGTDQLEALKNTWVRLVTEMQEHETFFSTLSDRQFIYNKNK